MIRATLARFLVKQMSERGIAAADLLIDTGIDGQELSNPEYAVDIAQLIQLIDKIAPASAADPLGLELGVALSIQDLGIMGHALMSCPTLAELYPFWESYFELVGTPIRNHSTLRRDTWSLELMPTRPLGSLEQFCIEQHLGFPYQLSSLLLQTPLQFKEVKLCYSEPPYLDKYEQLFPCPIRFNQPHNELIVDRSQLSTSVATADTETFSLCVHYCQTVLEKLVNADSLASRIRQELVNSPGSTPRADEMASMMGWSERKLRRLLQAETTTYSDVVRNYRLDLSREYLKNSNLAPKQIGYLLGFEDTSSFRRAFKQWTGQTVGDYRRALSSS